MERLALGTRRFLRFVLTKRPVPLVVDGVTITSDPVPTEQIERGLRKLPPAMAQLLHNAPKDRQIVLSYRQYRELMEL